MKENGRWETRKGGSSQSWGDYNMSRGSKNRYKNGGFKNNSKKKKKDLVKSGCWIKEKAGDGHSEVV